MLDPRRNTDLDRKLRSFRVDNYPIYAVYLIVALIFLLALYNFTCLLTTYLAIRYSFPCGASENTERKDEESCSISMVHRGNASLKHVPDALLGFLRIAACRLSFPLLWGLNFPLIELIVCLGHLATMLAFTFVNGISFIPFQ